MAAAVWSLRGPISSLRGPISSLRGWADRTLASPRFQRWAAAFVLTRPIARARTRDLFDLCAGFVYSQVLFACVRVGLFPLLLEAPRTEAALAGLLGLPPEATGRLLRAAVALRLVDRRGGGRYGLGALGAAVAGNPGIAAMVEHHALLYADLADPVALLRGTEGNTALSRYWAYARAERPGALEDARTAQYTALMGASQALIAAAVIDVARLDRHACLLDVGGGDGSFLAAVAARVPGLRLMLFDLPPVAARAAARFAAGGVAAQAVGGDFRTDALPEGADVATLVRVLHDHDDAAALTLLRAVRRALPDHGALLVAEPMAETPGAAAAGDAYFGFYLLAMGSGRPRSPAAIMALLRAAGFARARLLRTANPLLARVIRASGRTPESVNQC